MFLLAAQQFEDAKGRAERALQLDHDNVDALILRANATAGLKDIAGAIKDIEEAIETQTSDSRIYASLGALRAAGGQTAEAEAAFKKAVEVAPSSVPALLSLANFYWVTGRPAEVERTLDTARKLDGSDLMVNRMLAALYMATRRPADAEAPLKVVADRSGDAASRLMLADYYVQVQRPADARQVLQPLVEAADANAALRLAQIERQEGQSVEARRMIDQLLAKEPRNAPALTLLSGWHLLDGDSSAALEVARAAVDANPASAPPHFALGQALFRSGRHDEAAAALREVLRLNPRIVAAQLLLSDLELAAGEAGEAVRLASEARNAAPTSVAVRVALARSLLARGDLQRAEPEIKLLLTNVSQLASSHALSGMLLMARRDLPRARAAFNDALKRDPTHLDALEGLLALDVQAKDVAAAIDRIEARRAGNPQNAAVHFVAGRTYLAAGQSAEAERALRSALKVDPNHFNSYVMLGQMFAAQRRLDEALAEFDLAAAVQPRRVAAATMAAMILQMQNKEAEAQKRYEAIVAVNDRAPVAANNLAWMYAEGRGNLDVALQLAQAAKSQLPDVPEINDTLGWIYVKKDLPRQAIPLLEQSVATDPRNSGYQLHLGIAYAKNGETDKAMSALERALQLNPTPADAELARQTISSMKG
ncbi:MAG: tetratricopeptide repeat protein [Acidobacteriota bacterium]